MAAFRTAGACLALAAGGFFAASAPAQLRVVNYNVAQLNGVQSALQGVFTGLITDDKPGFAVAPHLLVFGEVQSGDVAPLLTRLNNAGAPFGIVYTQGTYTNNGENGTAGAQAMFYRADTLIEIPAGHRDLNTGGGRQADRWQLRLVGHSGPDAELYIYSAHLKASTGSSNEQERLAGAQLIRADADALPAGTHILYCGDWNVYSNNEPAYQHFISPGNGQGVDALGSGPWGGLSNAIKHTQSPQLSGPLVGGGMDDRFDHQMGTHAWHDGEGLSLIPGTYRAFGNDGNHYNAAINTGNNSYYPGDLPRSNALADVLYDASDHVPVVADYQLPAVLSTSMNGDVGRVLVGAPVDVEVTIQNAVVVVEPTGLGADELDYVVSGAGALLGGGSGMALATIPPSPAVVLMTVDTSAVGPLSGAADVSTNSQGAANPSVSLPLTGQVVRHAQPSFSESSLDDTLVLSPAFATGSGVQPIAFDVFNFAFDADQALLDLDAIDGLASPLSLGGALPAGVGATPAGVELDFDTTGLAPGDYVYALTIDVSDEDLPGAVEGELLVDLTVTITGAGLLGDLDGDCDVDLTDVSITLASFSKCQGQENYNPAADLDGSLCVDLTDLSIQLAHFSEVCP